jgi:integrase
MGSKVKTATPGVYKRVDNGRTFSFLALITIQGRQVTKSFAVRDYGKGSKAESMAYQAARGWKREQEELGSKGKLGDAAKGQNMTLSELRAEVYAARDYAKKTLVLQRSLWQYVEKVGLDRQRISRIEGKDVTRLLRMVDGPWMAEKVRSFLSTLYVYAVEHGWVYVNPVPKRAAPKTRAERLQRESSKTTKGPRYLTPEQLDKLLEAMPDRYRALVEVMARVGLRPGEAYALTADKLKRVKVGDRLYWTLLIDTSVSGFTKTGRVRTVVVPDPVGENLLAHMDRYGVTGSDLVFTASGGGQIIEGNFRDRDFGPAVDRAGINGGAFTPNDLRHSAAAFAIANGANVYSVQNMLGHAKASMTLDVYGSLWESSQYELADALTKAIMSENKAKALTA